jgi:hypothetical protein
MNITTDMVQQVFQNLQDYNPVVSSVIDKVTKALIPIAIAILSILFLFEWLELRKQLTREGGTPTMELMVNMAVKYIIAYVVIMASPAIVDFIIWLGIQISKWINSVMPSQNMELTIPAVKGSIAWYQKPFLYVLMAIAQVMAWLGQWITTIILYLRALMLFFYKALAPIMVVFFMNDEMRNISIGFLKQVAGLVLQGALLILIIGIYPTLVSADFLTVAASGDFLSNVGMFFTIIGKAGIFIFLIIGSQRLSNKMMGALS